MTLWQEIQQIEEELEYYKARTVAQERTIRELTKEIRGLKEQMEGRRVEP